MTLKLLPNEDRAESLTRILNQELDESANRRPDETMSAAVANGLMKWARLRHKPESTFPSTDPRRDPIQVTKGAIHVQRTNAHDLLIWCRGTPRDVLRVERADIADLLDCLRSAGFLE